MKRKTLKNKPVGSAFLSFGKSETKNETFPMEVRGVSDEMIIADMITHDFIVQMPPVKEYVLRVKVKSIKKATPHIVDPEEF